MAADADLGTTAGEIWVNQSAGTSACASTLALSANHALHFVQGGTYNLNSGAANGIAVNNGDSIIGPNDKSLVLAHAGTATELAPQSTAALTSNVLLQNVSFTGTAAASIGLDLNNSTYWSVEHVIVSGFSKTGAIGIRRYTSGGLNGSYYDYFNDVYSNLNYDDWTWDVDGSSSGYPPNRDRCIFCKADNSTRYGFNINAGGTQSFYGCSAEGSGNTALVVNTSDNHFDACNLENFGSSGTGVHYSTVGSRNVFNGSISGGFGTQVLDDTTGTAGLNSTNISGGVSPLIVTNFFDLPQNSNSYLFMGGGYPSSILGKIYIGSGGGWRLGFSKRSGGVDTDEWYMQDDGTLQGVETAIAPQGGVGIAGRDLLWPDVNIHRWKMNNNNGMSDAVAGVATPDILSNKTLNGASSGNSITKMCYSPSGGAILGNAAAQSLYTCTLNANVLAPNSCVRYTVWWQHTTGIAAVSYQWNFGSQAMPAFSDSGTSMSKSVLTVCNGGTANSQQLAEEAAIDGINLVSGSQALINTGAVSTTANVTVSFTFNVANSDAVKPYQILGELVQ